MTNFAAGRTGNQSPTISALSLIRLIGWVMIVAGIAVIVGSGAGWAGPSRAIDAKVRPWRDHATGFAIGGFDPMGYFIAGKPVVGREDYEHKWSGAVWRFRNPGNLDAFSRRPERYSPRFGGYDVHAVSRGHAVAGHPSIWAIYRGRLYLFHSAANKLLWSQAPDLVLQDAEANWLKVRRSIY